MKPVQLLRLLRSRTRGQPLALSAVTQPPPPPEDPRPPKEGHAGRHAEVQPSLVSPAL